MPYDITDAMRDIQLLDQKLEAVVEVLIEKKVIDKPKEEEGEKKKG